MNIEFVLNKKKYRINVTEVCLTLYVDDPDRAKDPILIGYYTQLNNAVFKAVKYAAIDNFDSEEVIELKQLIDIHKKLNEELLAVKEHSELNATITETTSNRGEHLRKENRVAKEKSIPAPEEEDDL